MVIYEYIYTLTELFVNDKKKTRSINFCLQDLIIIFHGCRYIRPKPAFSGLFYCLDESCGFEDNAGAENFSYRNLARLAHMGHGQCVFKMRSSNP